MRALGRRGGPHALSKRALGAGRGQRSSGSGGGGGADKQITLDGGGVGGEVLYLMYPSAVSSLGVKTSLINQRDVEPK